MLLYYYYFILFFIIYLLFQILFIKSRDIIEKKLLSGAFHFSVLNPFFIYYDYEYYKDYSSPIVGDFSFSEKHKDLIPFRIIYTSIIILVCSIGLVNCIIKNPKLSLLLIFSILYYYFMAGWYGKTRLFVPCLIYISIFFGSGFNLIFNKLKN